MQVLNSNTEVKALDVSTDGGKTWKPTTRQPYNYFENSSGFGTDIVTVRITSSIGTNITVSGMSVASLSSKIASSNFWPCFELGRWEFNSFFIKILLLRASFQLVLPNLASYK